MADFAPTFGKPDEKYKVVLIGEPGVGKTAIFRRLMNGTFDADAGSTLGVDCIRKKFTVAGNQEATVSAQSRNAPQRQFEI